MTWRKHFVPVTIGDEPLIAECTVTGRFRPAIISADPLYCCPAEFPEVEVVCLWTQDQECNLFGLLAHDLLLQEIEGQCYDYLEAHQDDGPDPDEERERAQEHV